MSDETRDDGDGEARTRGPLYVVIAAMFLPFLALLFPYQLLDDHRRTRELVAMGATHARDPKRAPRPRDGFFWGAGAVWLAALLALPAARAGGRQELATVLLLLLALSGTISGVLLLLGWVRRDRRTPSEKQAQFAVAEAQVQGFFAARERQRSEAGIAFTEPAVPWIGRAVWRRWFLVRWDPEGGSGEPEGPPLGIEIGPVGEHATPVTARELDEAPVIDVIGDVVPPRGTEEPSPHPEVMSPDACREALRTATPAPFRFPGLSWPRCHERLAVLVWEGNVGSAPDGIGLPMGAPAAIEALIRRAQGLPPWELRLGWDGNAVFQCAECGRLYWREYEG